MRIGAAAAAVVAVAVVLVFVLADSDESPVTPVTPAFERGKGGTLSFDGPAHTWCGPFGGAGEEPLLAETLYVFHGRVSGARAAAWSLRAVVEDVRVGRTCTLPSPYGDDVANPAGFALYVLLRADPTIEASSLSDRSSGTLTFEELSCERGATVAFRISGTLGSEFFDGEPVNVTGTFRDVVGSRPESLPEGIP